MRLLLFSLVAMICVSCRSTAILSNPSGEYIVRGKDYEVYINLRPDSSYVYREKNMEIRSEAKGRWKYNLADTIYLIRDNVSLSEKLSGGYKGDMPDKLIVENRNKVKVGRNMLKRTNKLF